MTQSIILFRYDGKWKNNEQGKPEWCSGLNSGSAAINIDDSEITTTKLKDEVCEKCGLNKSLGVLSRSLLGPRQFLKDCAMMGGGFELRWKRRIISFLVLILRVNGWGKEGHYAICKIAENLFTEDALAAVKSLLPERAEGDLASVCSWADEVRRHPHYRWSSHLHYVNTPDFACNYEYARDCHKDRCVTGAIYNYTMQLMSGRNNDSDLTAIKYNLTEALMFLSHFVGDVHQPLHVGFKGDEGGNTIIVRWYRRKTNLHHVWDTMIIESAMKKFYNSELSTMIQSIQINITDGYFDDESTWQNCNETVCPDTLSTLIL